MIHRPFKKLPILPLLLLLIGCGSENPDESDSQSNSTEEVSDLDSNVVIDPYEGIPVLKATIDTEAMDQVGQWTEEKYDDAIELYHSGADPVERWSDKLWCRCCTEADMRLSEHLTYIVETSHKGKEYPWENVRAEGYDKAYVFEAKESITITVKVDDDEDFWGHYGDKTFYDLISETDTMMTNFQFSLINGYVKSSKTFQENARIKKVELWLNGELMCLVELLDVPEIQMIEGNFPLFSKDVIEIKPIAYFEGTKYDDVCITTVQFCLGHSCHPGIDAKIDYGWN